MARPRWHALRPRDSSPLGRRWDRFVALWASLNLLWVAFDLTYVPLRSFWLQRNLYPLPGTPLVVPLGFIPDVTPWVDPIKGIEPHRETEAYLKQFQQLEQAMAQAGNTSVLSPRQQQLLLQQAQMTVALIDSNPFLAANASGTLEKLKNRLRQRADQDSAKVSATLLLSPSWMASHPWPAEQRFWRQQILPLVATNYWRSIDENGRPTDHVWRVDLLLFQSVFALDILLRVIRLRRRLPGLSWRDAVLRRWIDLPLLLPFGRWLRLLPTVERLQTSGLINFEPLRAVISRAVVALLALELFEVLALQLLDGAQSLIRSRDWPRRLRALRSHQSVNTPQLDQELVALVRIWAPLLLSQVLPRLAPELQRLLGYSLRQSLQGSMVPAPLRQLEPLLQLESGLSSQLAGSMTRSLLELSRTTGNQLARTDTAQLELLQRSIDRFWEELAAALESGPVLNQTQELLNALLESFKGTYLSQISRSEVTSLIDELDLLMARSTGEAPAAIKPEPPATPPA
ncbi:MAG: hypothetical protein FJ050_02830 [Cyanobacteria bacterium M_surface_7_m2_040]|nr:hypothetical protein [Cyanobacteria bacterium M_surface_7_m2_040]